jgi:hypothetical protein
MIFIIELLKTINNIIYLFIYLKIVTYNYIL